MSVQAVGSDDVGSDDVDTTENGVRRIDRHRRQRIIDGTLSLIAEHGVRALSHRRVAGACNVPQSAPHYYFGTIEELLYQAFEHAVSVNAGDLTILLSQLKSGVPPSTVLTDYVCKNLLNPDSAAVSQELVLAARNDDRLKGLANGWYSAWEGALEPVLGGIRARLAVELIGALSLRGLISDPQLDRSLILQIFDSALHVPAGDR